MNDAYGYCSWWLMIYGKKLSPSTSLDWELVSWWLETLWWNTVYVSCGMIVRLDDASSKHQKAHSDHVNYLNMLQMAGVLISVEVPRRFNRPIRLLHPNPIPSFTFWRPGTKMFKLHSVWMWISNPKKQTLVGTFVLKISLTLNFIFIVVDTFGKLSLLRLHRSNPTRLAVD